MKLTSSSSRDLDLANQQRQIRYYEEQSDHDDILMMK